MNELASGLEAAKRTDVNAQNLLDNAIATAVRERTLGPDVLDVPPAEADALLPSALRLGAHAGVPPQGRERDAPLPPRRAAAAPAARPLT